MTDILRKTDTLEFVVDDGDAEVEYRLTFGACNGYQKSLFDRYRERAFGIIADEYAPPAKDGKKADVVPLARVRYAETVKALSTFERDAAESKLNAMILHAANLASLRKVEAKDGETWTEAKLPEFWYDMSAAVEQISSDLADALLVKTFTVNPPRLFGFLTDNDEEKKMLRLIVPKSVS